MNVFESSEVAGHEEVVFVRDADSGLRAIVAVHDTTLGPGLGGVRLRPYSTEAEALTDALRLSEAMTYKAAVAGLSTGGGKAVIFAPLRDRDAAFRAFGRFVASLGGRYVPTEDMGVGTADIEVLRETCPHAVGISEALGGGGDPSPMTALGVMYGLVPALEVAGLGSELRGRHVAIQGVGKVGGSLATRLLDAGAEVTVADVDEASVARAVAAGARRTSVEDVHRTPCDVFAPCAAGASLSRETIPELRCRVVAGAANNQLAEAADGAALRERGILYAPDYVINAGGLINVADELEPGGYDRSRVLARVEAIGATLRELFEGALAAERRPEEEALRMARERLEDGAARRRGRS